MKIEKGRMIALGYGRYFRSENIVGLERIEEGRGPGKRTQTRRKSEGDMRNVEWNQFLSCGLESWVGMAHGTPSDAFISRDHHLSGRAGIREPLQRSRLPLRHTEARLRKTRDLISSF